MQRYENFPLQAGDVTLVNKDEHKILLVSHDTGCQQDTVTLSDPYKKYHMLNKRARSWPVSSLVYKIERLRLSIIATYH